MAEGDILPYNKVINHKRETHEKNCNRVMNKQQVIESLEMMGIANYTPVYVADKNNANGNFCKMPIEAFFTEDAIEYLNSEDWVLSGVERADPEKTDMDEWAQEFDGHSIQDLKESLQCNLIKIASFRNEEYGTMNIMIW